MPSESWWPAPSMPRGRRRSPVFRPGIGAHREGAVRTGWTIRPTPPVPLWPGVELRGGGRCARRRPAARTRRGWGAGSGRGSAALGAGAAAHVRAVLGRAGTGASSSSRSCRCSSFDEGVVVEEPDVELVPEFPEVEVVAALATSAPPVTSPEVSAPTARTLRKRMCMAVVPFCVFAAPAPCEPVRQTVRSGSVRDRRVTWTGATSHATNR